MIDVGAPKLCVAQETQSVVRVQIEVARSTRKK
jgi:hypothetical protein